ncbi:MAG: polysaccharide biosynthesis protein [Bdellovibrionales bacterium]|nr:polysaccharide biosynthesis protein [Bdellovibrionales bacterium]
MPPWFDFYRLSKFVIFTVVTSVAGYTAALELRFDFQFSDQVPQFSLWMGLFLLLASRVLTYFLLGASDVIWRYFSLNSLVPVVRAHLLSSTIFAASVLIIGLEEFPRSIIFIEFLISIALNGGFALIVRLMFEHEVFPYSRGKISQHEQKECLVLGAGDSGHLLLKALTGQRKRFHLTPVAVLDDAARFSGSLIHGVRVVGKLAELDSVLPKFPGVEVVILAIPTLSASRIKQLEKICEAHQVQFRRIQSFEEIAVQSSTLELPEIPIEVILNREIQVQFEEEIQKTYHNQNILVTGGCGSIGSEVVRQLVKWHPRKITILDNSEYHHFLFQKELQDQFPETNFSFVLADVTDREHLETLFRTLRPETVIHTAAYKHVPMNESNPYAAFTTNVVGTRNVVELAVRYKCQRIIHLSTDKAVDPVNVMGCSKRIAEIVTQQVIRTQTESPLPRCAIVRFGNVINSRGSVIPLFRQQILSGGPVTVTHPEVERFFMSLQEAVGLMLAAGSLGNQAEIFVLDMGEKVKILDVAKEMLALYGREDIPIVFTGLRPGERLSEEVAEATDDIEPTSIPKVRRLTERQDSYPELLLTMENLKLRSASLSPQKLSQEMFQLVRRSTHWLESSSLS